LQQPGVDLRVCAAVDREQRFQNGLDRRLPRRVDQPSCQPVADPAAVDGVARRRHLLGRFCGLGADRGSHLGALDALGGSLLRPGGLGQGLGERDGNTG